MFRPLSYSVSPAARVLAAATLICAAGLPLAVQADPVTGALLGGLVGSRFGQGNGQIAATVVGAAIGAGLGDNDDYPRQAPAPAYYPAQPRVVYPQPVYVQPEPYRHHHHHHHHRPQVVYYPALPPGAVVVYPQRGYSYGY